MYDDPKSCMVMAEPEMADTPHTRGRRYLELAADMPLTESPTLCATLQGSLFQTAQFHDQVVLELRQLEECLRPWLPDHHFKPEGYGQNEKHDPGALSDVNCAVYVINQNLAAMRNFVASLRAHLQV